MFADDTNILIYAFDTTDARKHSIANQVLKAHVRAGFPIVLQSLQEFYFATTRKHLLSKSEAAQVVRDALGSSPIVETTQSDLLQALDWHDQHQFQFFDVLLLATAARVGCTTLFSEDFQHNRTYSTITVRNPFLLSPADLHSLLS